MNQILQNINILILIQNTIDLHTKENDNEMKTYIPTSGSTKKGQFLLGL